MDWDLDSDEEDKIEVSSKRGRSTNLDEKRYLNIKDSEVLTEEEKIEIVEAGFYDTKPIYEMPEESKINFSKEENIKKKTKNIDFLKTAKTESIVPLLTEINESGKLNFNIELLRQSGRYTKMILTLNKEKNMIFIKDTPKYLIQKAVVNSIISGGQIHTNNVPVKTINIDNLHRIEVGKYKRLTIFLHYTPAKKNNEKIKEVVFKSLNDMFAFLTVMSSIQCNLFDPPMAQKKTHELKDLLSVKLLTFNMARKGLEYQFDYFIDEIGDKDIVVFGFQECKLTARSKVIDFFNKALMANEFDIVNSNYIWEMVLIVAVSSQHRHAVGNIREFSKAKGFGGVIGNKAGLGCTFSVYNTLFTVFNVHLHAGQKNVEKRINMMNSLISEHSIGDEGLDATELSDYAFLIGDFNFRMKTTYTDIIDKVDLIHEQMELDEFYAIK